MTKRKYDCEFFESIPANKKSLRQRKMVHGFGINDAPFITRYEDAMGLGHRHPAYESWYQIISRCYAAGSYNCGATVCEQWRKFSGFLTWYKEHVHDGWDLVRVVRGSAAWGPENCVFLPRDLVDVREKLKTEKTGVGRKNRAGRVQARISIRGVMVHLGVFDTEQEANHAWAKARMDYLHEFKPRLDAIDKRLFEVMAHEVSMRVIA